MTGSCHGPRRKVPGLRALAIGALDPGAGDHGAKPLGFNETGRVAPAAGTVLRDAGGRNDPLFANQVEPPAGFGACYRIGLARCAG